MTTSDAAQRRQAQGDTAQRFIIICLLFLIAGLLGYGTMRKPNPQRFEYKLADLEDKQFDAQVNELGRACKALGMSLIEFTKRLEQSLK